MSTLRTVWRALAVSLVCGCAAPGQADTTEQAIESEAFADGEVNAVLGDASWVALHGERPGPDVPDVERIRTHLAYVDGLLRARDVSALSVELRVARARNLDRLSEYWEASLFPENRPGVGRVPRFVDDDEDGPLAALTKVRLCAVGHLLAADLGVDSALAIAADFQHAAIGEIDAPELTAWAASSGLSTDELAMIQPSYSGMRRPIEIDSRMPPAERAMRVLVGAASNPANTCVHERLGARAPHPKAAAVTVVVQPSGELSSVSVSLPPAQHTETRKCIADAVKKTTFPKFSGKPLTVTRQVPITGPTNEKGELNRAYLRVVFQRGEAAIRKCAAEGEAGHHGDLAINATAHPSGRFREIQLVNADKPAFRACVTQVVSTLELPIFKGEPVKDGHVYRDL